MSPAGVLLTIDPRTQAAFGEVQVAAFTVAGLRRARPALEPSAVVAGARASLGRAFGDASGVVADARVQAWRAAMRACGLSASDVRSSAEQLARRFLRDGGVSAADPVVQIYCAVSARHLAPIGAYDAERLPDRTVTLRPADSDDAFDPIGGGASRMPLAPEVMVYAAGREVLCWAFNHRDSARTALRGDSDEALFVSESAYAVQVDAMLAAAGELRDLLAGHGCAVGELAVATAGNPSVTVTAPAPSGQEAT